MREVSLEEFEKLWASGALKNVVMNNLYVAGIANTENEQTNEIVYAVLS